MTTQTPTTADNGQLDPLLSTRTVCRLLDTSDRNLRRLVASGKFPPPDRRLGRSLRWKASTVRGFLESETEPAAT